MSNSSNLEAPKQLSTLTLIVFAFSIVFFAVLANGYYILFVKNGVILAGFIGVLLAFIAWSLGKFIGSSESGIRGHIPMFVLMLLLSAVGVFNSLMMNLEGQRIFQESIDNASARYKELPILAKQAMRDDVIEAKIAKLDSLMNSLEQEIRNPRNCGEGPEARRIIIKIKEELPDFEKLSGNTSNCEVNDQEINQLIDMYRTQINVKLFNSKLFVDKNYTELVKARTKIIQTEEVAQLKLGQLRTEVSNGTDSRNLLSNTRPQLEALASEYQSLALDLSKYSRGDVASKVEPTLDLSAVRNLGEWSQLINLMISRLDKLQTYVYLFIALFADWILIYLFAHLRTHRLAQPKKRNVADKTINNPW
jgi:hypothetical protein